MSWLDNVVIGPPGPAGPAGPTGPTGATGEPAYTFVSAPFVQPNVLGFATIDVISSLWMATGAYLFIDTGGTYQVTSIVSSTQIVAMLVDAIAAPASTVAGGVLVSPSGVPGAGGGGVVRPYPTDADDLHVWALDETSGTSFANSGASSLALTGSGSLLVGTTGIWAPSVSTYASSAAYLSSGNTTDVPGTGAITASVWVYHLASSNSFAFCKFAAPPPAFSSPYGGFLITRNLNTTYFWIAYGPSSYQQLTPSPSLGPDLQDRAWNHLGLTYDGTTFSAYINGDLVNTAALSGTLTFPSNGPYVIGSDRSGTASSVQAKFADARVATVARPASWFREVYQRGLYGV